MMRRFAVVALVLALGGAAPVHAQTAPGAAAAQLDPARLALANEIIDLSYPPETRHAMLVRTSDAMTVQVRAAVLEASGGNVDDGLRAILDRHLARLQAQAERTIASESAPIFTAFTRAYARRFSLDELTQIKAFVATPTGSKFIREGVELISDPDVAQANTTYMTAAFEAIRPLQEELFTEVRQYLEQRDGRRGEPATGAR